MALGAGRRRLMLVGAGEELKGEKASRWMDLVPVVMRRGRARATRERRSCLTQSSCSTSLACQLIVLGHPRHNSKSRSATEQAATHTATRASVSAKS